MTAGASVPTAMRTLAPAGALVLVALCLRGPFSAVGPVVVPLREEYQLTTPALAVLTALPLVCFAVLSPTAPALARLLGLHRTVLLATSVVGVGVALRLLGTAGLFAGTILLAGGIGVVNVLLPALARAEYGPRSPAVLGATTGSIALSASLGAGLAQPLTAVTGSARAGLALWMLPLLLAAAAMGALAVLRQGGNVPLPPRPARGVILSDRVAQVVALYFGLQSLSFYAMLTWLPAVLQEEAGMSPAAAGGLLAGATALGAPAALVVPGRAARSDDQTRWVLAVTLPAVLAVLGLLLAPAAAPALWTLLYGLGTGAAFPLAMVLILLRTRDVAQTGRLSAAAQSSGYLLAAAGPLVVGVLNEFTGGWTAGLAVLLVVLVAQLAAGLAAARSRLVMDRAPRQG
jgi:CP family cyanate transporter-like MFS transporter